MQQELTRKSFGRRCRHRVLAASPEWIPAIEELVFTHGPNPWNYLPEEPVRRHIAEIAHGTVEGILACRGETLIGVVLYHLGTDYDRYEPERRRGRQQGQISEGIVHRSYARRGLGQRLVAAATEELLRRGVDSVYCHLHEENVASMRLVTRIGFELVDVFFDPQRRTVGSRRTAIMRYPPRLPGFSGGPQSGIGSPEAGS